MYHQNPELEAQPLAPKTRLSWGRQFKELLAPSSLALLIALGIALTYYAFSHPYSFAVIVAVLLPLVPLLIAEKTTKFQAIRQRLGLNLKSWHLVAAGLAVALWLNLNPPAHAFFAQLEGAIKTVMENSGVDGGAVEFVTTLFLIIRIAIVFAIIFGIVYGINQSMQGNDIKPVLTAFAIGVVSMIGIEGLSSWVLNLQQAYLAPAYAVLTGHGLGLMG